MSELALVLAVAAITFASRATFLLKPRQTPGGVTGRFLAVFPLALFLAIATSGLAAPEGTIEVTPALAGGLGGVLGGVVSRRSLWGVLVVGAVFFYGARALYG